MLIYPSASRYFEDIEFKDEDHFHSTFTFRLSESLILQRNSKFETGDGYLNDCKTVVYMDTASMICLWTRSQKGKSQEINGVLEQMTQNPSDDKGFY